jgi:hypothetical protein
MSGWFITTIVVTLIALACYGGAIVVVRSDGDRASRGLVWGGLAAIVAVFALGTVISSATLIPTRSVGVEVEFGKPVGSLTNGLHWVAPWASVEKFDASVQTTKLDGKDDTPCVTVRLGNSTQACVDVVTQWNIDPNGDVIELYRSYHSFDKIESNLVLVQLQHALRDTFGTFDPLAALADANAAKQPSLDELAATTKSAFAGYVGAGITVKSVTVSLVHYDGDTENRLKAYQQALADTRIAQQRKATAQQVADANNILAGNAASKDPGVQYQNCLNLISDLAQKGLLKDLPPTFNCNSGAQSPVIVGGK